MLETDEGRFDKKTGKRDEVLTVAQSSERAVRVDAGDVLLVLPKCLFWQKSKLLITGTDVSVFL